MTDNIKEVRESVAKLAGCGFLTMHNSDALLALLADHARLQRLEAALADWSLAANSRGTVGVVCRRPDGPGGDIALPNAGRLEQRLLHALVTDIATAQKAVQP